MFRKIAPCIAAVLVASCGAVNKHRSPTSESDCTAAGGTWTPIENLPPTSYCDLKTSDAGKWCVDAMQCEGFCLASENAKVGSFTTGQCSDHTQDYGTKKVVQSGRVLGPKPVL